MLNRSLKQFQRFISQKSLIKQNRLEPLSVALKAFCVLLNYTQGKSVQVVNFEGNEGCGCGGTYINSAKEIGRITIRKIKSKKGVTRVSYSLDF